MLNNTNGTAEPGTTDCRLDLTGSGFYEPGIGWPKHLTVELIGGDVNGIGNYRTTYVDSGNVTVTFDVAADASFGPRNILLTNPDGQTATLAGAFTVTATPPPPPPPPPPTTVEAAKKQPDGAAVTIEGAIVSAAWSGSTVYYISDPDGNCAIRVESSVGVPAAKTVVTISGVSRTGTEGERYIQVSSWSSTGAATISPVVLSNPAVGGSDWFYDPATGAGQRGIAEATGPNNIGTLAKLSGVVTQNDPQRKYFYLDDGSGILDGTTSGEVPNVGVRIKYGTYLTPGRVVTVTGIVSCFKDAAGQLRRRIMPLSGGVK